MTRSIQLARGRLLWSGMVTILVFGGASALITVLNGAHGFASGNSRPICVANHVPASSRSTSERHVSGTALNAALVLNFNPSASVVFDGNGDLIVALVKAIGACAASGAVSNPALAAHVNLSTPLLVPEPASSARALFGVTTLVTSWHTRKLG